MRPSGRSWSSPGVRNAGDSTPRSMHRVDVVDGAGRQVADDEVAVRQPEHVVRLLEERLCSARRRGGRANEHQGERCDPA